MPVQTILALIAIAVLANVALIAVSAGQLGERFRAARRRDPTAARGTPGGPDELTNGAPSATPVEGRPVSRADHPGVHVELRPAALDRVIRVGTWIFLFAATTIVAVTDVWGENRAAIIGILVTAGAYNLLLHEIVRPRLAEAVVLVAEGAAGLVFAAILVALTGGSSSPFFFAFPLIVVGAAIVVAPEVTLALTAGAGVAYLAAVIAGSPATLSATVLATLGVNLTALGLVAYVGMALGREQRRAREEVALRATVDQLTGLRTRAYLFGALERELSRSSRTGRGFCLLMIDLDELKAINDRHGHLHGDRALQAVGDVIRAGIRRIDTGARFGGDEFVVLLPETDPTGGWVLAEKIRQGVAEVGINVAGATVATSVSVGLVTYPDDGETVDELLERADDAMYRSKRSGRDRVTGVPVMDVEPSPARSGGRPV